MPKQCLIWHPQYQRVILQFHYYLNMVGQLAIQVNANYLIYDECQGDWDRIAERIPYTIAHKMERYVSEQLGTRTEMKGRNKRNIGNGKEQEEEEEEEVPMGDKELEKQRRTLFANGQEEGRFY